MLSLGKYEIKNLPNAKISYIPKFLSDSQAEEYFNIFFEKVNWKSYDIKLFGKTYPQPRLVAFYNSSSLSYGYSGQILNSQPYFRELKELQRKAEEACEHHFNSVLLNLYRNGNDSNGWHSDNEKSLGINPFIASVSLGANRAFHLKHRDNGKVMKLILENGSLFTMGGETQHFYKHQLPKSKLVLSPRINLTFRTLKY